MFKIGDVVRLKSGGPLMTVQSIWEDGQYQCAWFVDSKSPLLSSEMFQPETLKQVNLN
ncbi:MAG: DUF2158 domain-containing protein [Gammaproteobacteria bacterium]|nr:DUF2158 domain-containing protein [Gammaproteobacteria bacterium]